MTEDEFRRAISTLYKMVNHHIEESLRHHKKYEEESKKALNTLDKVKKLLKNRKDFV